MEPDMLRGDGQGGCGSSYGGDSPQQSSRRWENYGPVWRSCYEYAVVTSCLKRDEATESYPGQDEDIEALWRKRGELAKAIVDADAPTIQDLLLKVAMTASLLSEGEVAVGLTLQCLEEYDRAIAQEGDGEQCLKALEPELWQRARHRMALRRLVLAARFPAAVEHREGSRPFLAV